MNVTSIYFIAYIMNVIFLSSELEFFPREFENFRQNEFQLKNQLRLEFAQSTILAFSSLKFSQCK